MSAIAGLWWVDGRNAEGACSHMLDAQRAYGLDAQDYWANDGVAVGRNLARILPEDHFDAQPAIGGGGRFVLVADLRLDNRAEIGAALGIDGTQLAVTSDAALLLAAWERWQEACLCRIVGDFAFAVWDANRRVLSLARSLAGLRPLHFHVGKSLFAFASMPKGLHALAEIDRAPDLDFVGRTLAQGFPPASGSWFSDIARVRPGHFVTVCAAGVTERRWWHPPSELLRLKAPSDYAEALRHHLDEAVRVRLRGQSHVAAHLSGGLDSSAVATSAAHILNGVGKVTAFTALPRPGYCDSRSPPLLDEGPLASAAAAAWANIEHVTLAGAGPLPLESLDFYTNLFDQPVPNLCNLPWISAIGEAARRRGLNVLLTGQYGNLGFSYDGLLLLSELLRRGRLTALAKQILALRRSGYVRLQSAVGAAIRPLMVRSRPPALHRQPSGGRPSPVGERELRIHGFEATDVGNFLKGQLAATGVDCRDPTADRRLVEFTFSVPPEQFLFGGIPRSLVRRAMAGRLPDAILHERRKGIQAPDWHEPAFAQRTEMSAELDAFAATSEAHILPIARLRALLTAWPQADWSRPGVSRTYRSALLRHISLANFLRQASRS